MNDLKQEKSILRAQVKSLRSQAKVSLKNLYGAGFAKGCWGVFKPLNDEPELIDFPSNADLCWPVIKSQALSEMVLAKSEDFVKSDLGFEEPAVCNEIPKNKISAVIVPGLAFDFKGNRLGRGKGYYDRYLKDFTGVTVGVCSRERFLMKPIPVDPKFDVAVQYVLTDQFLYKVNPFGKVV